MLPSPRGPKGPLPRSRSILRSCFPALSLPAAFAFAIAAAPSSAVADDGAPADEVRRLREELDAERRAREALEARLSALERGPAPAVTREEIAAQIDSYLTEKDMFEGAPVEATIPHSGSLIDVSVVLQSHFGTSTASDPALSGGIALGDHDPHVRGANVRNEEFVVSADVDPYFYAFLDVVFKIDEEGESAFELEEAFGLTTALPCHLQLKFGQFFTEFGRATAVHPHAWEFHDYPVVLARVFGGDGFRGQGARLSWAVPGTTCTPVTVLFGAQNARGETQASFLAEEGELVGEHELQRREVESLLDLSYHARVEASRDFEGCGGTTTVLGGLSLAVGPNSTGEDGRTEVYGADLYVKWRPKSTDGGWPWVAWQTEAVYRDYHADAQTRLVDDGMGGFVPLDVPGRDYVDWGFYTQATYGFARPWSLGARLDHADSDGAFVGSHTRGSLALSYYPSEFSRIRLQGQYDHIEGLSSDFPGESDGNFSIWLGFDLSIGKHGAHKF